MPFDSRAQARFMFATHPQMATRWAAETPSFSTLPERLSGGRPIRVTGKPRLLDALKLRHPGRSLPSLRSLVRL